MKILCNFHWKTFEELWGVCLVVYLSFIKVRMSEYLLVWKKWLVCPNFIENDKLKVIRGKFRYKFLEIFEIFNNFREINFRVSIKIQLWHIMSKSLIPCINDIFSVYEHRKSVIYAQNHRYVCFIQEICDEKTNLMKFRWMSSSVSYYHKWYLVIRNVNIKIMTNNDKM